MPGCEQVRRLEIAEARAKVGAERSKSQSAGWLQRGVWSLWHMSVTLCLFLLASSSRPFCVVLNLVVSLGGTFCSVGSPLSTRRLAFRLTQPCATHPFQGGPQAMSCVDIVLRQGGLLGVLGFSECCTFHDCHTRGTWSLQVFSVRHFFPSRSPQARSLWVLAYFQPQPGSGLKTISNPSR